MSKILTVTLNPALDLTVNLESLDPGEVNVATEGHLHAAGKGINVARVLADLKLDVSVAGMLGKDNRHYFDEYFKQYNLENRFVFEEGATRINVKVKESSERVTDINLPGIEISETVWQQFLKHLVDHVDQYELIVLGGSLPRGLPEDAYAQIINMLKPFGKKIILDTSGAALTAAISSAPALIKPNVEELEQWAGKSLKNRDDEAETVQGLIARGIQNVVVSDGKNGSRWYTQDSIVQAKAPKVNVVSTVGAGDSMVAGIAFGMVNNYSTESTLKFATAVAAYAVEQVGVGVHSAGRLHELHNQVLTSSDQERA